jgi:DNA-binding CsgD family transcriptional regulator
MIGRTRELATIRAVADGARRGEAGIVLLSGDAGIGKTRLVDAAVTAAAEDGFITAVGGCVQLGTTSVAFAPLAQALRQVHLELTAQAVDPDPDSNGRAAATDLLARCDDLRRRVGADLTERAETDGGPAAGPHTSGSRVLDRVLDFLVDLGSVRPVLLVFEDLHWADASTRDLVAFLARNLRVAPVVIVLTYRGEEVTRRHPLRPVLTAVEREPHVDRIRLEGLVRDDLAALLGEIGEVAVADDQLETLLARSGGNPLYVEELVAAGTIAGGLPDSLADVILARVAELDDEAQDVLHAAAVVAASVDDELVAAASGRPVATVAAALREAVARGLLTLDGDSCRFRHALIREALYDDLLPGERSRLHVGAARAVEQAERLAPHTRWALLAHHWDAAHDAPRAFEASIRAATEAENVHAFSDAEEQYERALALRDQVPDADERCGVTLPDLLLRAADAVVGGRLSRRGVDLAEAALRELDPDAPPEARALIYERIARINWILVFGPDAVAAYEKAAALVADRPASRDRAFVLGAMGQSLMLRHRHREAVEVLRGAIADAEHVGAVDVQGHALCSLGPSLASLGHVDEAITTMLRARELASIRDRGEDVSRCFTNVMSVYHEGARYEEAVALCTDAMNYVQRSGYFNPHGPAIAGNVMACLIALGRWDVAEALGADPRLQGPHASNPYKELRRMSLLAATGRWEAYRVVVADMLATTERADDVQYRDVALLHAARLAAHDAEWARAQEMLTSAEEHAASTDDQIYRAELLGHAVSSAADHAEAARAAGDEPGLSEARQTADRALARSETFAAELAAANDTQVLPYTSAWFVASRAEHARAHQSDSVEQWAATAEAWRTLGHPYAEAWALTRQAEVELRINADRAAAGPLLHAAATTAERLGAIPLQEHVAVLARAARVDQRRAPLNSALTPRELDVLRLVAQGRTNRQIGTALFISDKTASVHVTNLLRKLDVPNRAAAAAYAQRHGLA